MKLLHLSDLHLGKKLNEFSLYEDQKYILQSIVQLIGAKQPDCVLLAGDIYDKPVPPAEAVVLCDEFLNQLAALKVPVCIISGNHDSAERLSFGAQLMSSSGIHFAGSYNGQAQQLVLEDEFGRVNIFLLPFLKPAIVKHWAPEEASAEITGYHDAVKYAVSQLPLVQSERNVLVAHQFVTGAVTAGSEAVNVGGLDNIGAEVFADFDYVALGHIHNPQNVGGNERIRYCGTPLKYSFSEWQQQKSVTMIELAEKGNVKLTLLPLTPLRELRYLKDSFENLMAGPTYAMFPIDENGCLQDFYYLTLTDENDVPNAMQRLQSVYKNLLQLDYDNKRTQTNAELKAVESLEEKTPLELIDDFYRLQNNQELSEEQKQYLTALLSELGGDML